VMTNGSGRMADYAAEVSPEDRWAIAAYIQALQFSRHAPVDRLEPRDFRALNAVKTPAPSRRPPATGPTKTDSPREEGQTR
jgi:mono/diheme cytochrome c family protein